MCVWPVSGVCTVCVEQTNTREVNMLSLGRTYGFTLQCLGRTSSHKIFSTFLNRHRARHHMRTHQRSSTCRRGRASARADAGGQSAAAHQAELTSTRPRLTRPTVDKEIQTQTREPPFKAICCAVHRTTGICDLDGGPLGRHNRWRGTRPSASASRTQCAHGPPRRAPSYLRWAGTCLSCALVASSFSSCT